MQKAEIITETKQYIYCPCGKDKFAVDHIFQCNMKSFGTWYCESCGCGIKGQFDGLNISIELDDRRTDDALAVLKKDDVLLVVKSMFFDNEVDFSGRQYYFEEHTCPTNYFRDTRIVVDLKDKDTDPHGLFKLIDFIPCVKDGRDEDERFKEVENIFHKNLEDGKYDKS